MTRGWKSSEFWSMVLTTLVTVGVAFGFVRPEAQADLSKAIIDVIAMVVAVLPNLVYIISRTWLKGKSS